MIKLSSEGCPGCIRKGVQCSFGGSLSLLPLIPYKSIIVREGFYCFQKEFSIFDTTSPTTSVFISPSLIFDERVLVRQPKRLQTLQFPSYSIPTYRQSSHFAQAVSKFHFRCENGLEKESFKRFLGLASFLPSLVVKQYCDTFPCTFTTLPH